MIFLLLGVFLIGYLFITLEHPLKINKAATALLTAGICWSIYAVFNQNPVIVSEKLSHHLSEASGILFFLLAAMVIVELIDAYNGFDIIVKHIKIDSKRKLLWVVSLLTFLLSAILDNLTTTIVMISLLRKLVSNDKDRLYFAGIIVIAANAGGAWSPIGDVTTTMLWISGQITSNSIIYHLFLPSLVCLLVPLVVLMFILKGKVEKLEIISDKIERSIPEKYQYLIFVVGIAILLFVPVFKSLTHLPPYMGVLMGLGILWIITEIIQTSKSNNDNAFLSVSHALKKIDTSSILFFLGILLVVASLQTAGVLSLLSSFLSKSIANDNTIVLIIGLLSSVIDNVPLVAGTQGMYSLNIYPVDHNFWTFLAYAAGTGGSALIIGSAAGIAAMGMEKISFSWYLKRFTILALLGYFSGAICYLVMFH